MPILNFNNCHFQINGDVVIGPHHPIFHPVHSQTSRIISELAPELQQLYNLMPHREYGEISVVGDGILRFHSVEHYENVMDILHEDCEKWDSLFSDKYSYMDFEQMDAFCEKIHYNPFLPILVFEDYCGITGKTLFDTQAIAIQKWIDADFAGDNPTDSVFILESEQAVHNTHREVCINNTIYQYRDEAVVEIPLSSFDLWSLHRSDSIETLPALFTIHKNEIRGGTSVQVHYFNFKSKGVLYHQHFNQIGIDEKVEWHYKGKAMVPMNQRRVLKVTTKMICYKKNANGKYRRNRRACGISPHVTFYYIYVVDGEESPIVQPTDINPTVKNRTHVSVTRKIVIPRLENVNSHDHGVLKTDDASTYGVLASEKIVIALGDYVHNINI